MATFDFIVAKEFRESLESDYSEMQKGYDAETWKSVQVVAGSIVESLLIDYLISTSNPSRSKKDPMKLDLAEAITIAKSEGALSERTSDLCSVIRSYRNLIHPGRMVRLGEPAPDKGSASIAKALVDIILEELSRNRRASVGLTGEQLISKLLRDTNSLTILKHLIAEVGDFQKERLLLELIPEAFQELHEGRTSLDKILSIDHPEERLRIAFRTMFDSASLEVKSRVANNFVRILRGEDGDVVTRYSTAFFKFSDLEYVQTQQQPMVREHLFARIPSVLSPDSLRLLDGVQKVLQKEDMLKWLDPYIRAIVISTVKSVDKIQVREHLMKSADSLDSSLEPAIDRRLDDWIRHFEKNGSPESAEEVRELKEELNSQRIPF